MANSSERTYRAQREANEALERIADGIDSLRYDLEQLQMTTVAEMKKAMA